MFEEDVFVIFYQKICSCAQTGQTSSIKNALLLKMFYTWAEQRICMPLKKAVQRIAKPGNLWTYKNLIALILSKFGMVLFYINI